MRGATGSRTPSEPPATIQRPEGDDDDDDDDDDTGGEDEKEDGRPDGDMEEDGEAGVSLKAEGTQPTPLPPPRGGGGGGPARQLGWGCQMGKEKSV